jgi:cell division protein FtsB
MNNLLTTKNQIILLFSLLLMTILSTCNSCNTKNEVNRLRKEEDKLEQKIDSLSFLSVTKIDLQIEGLKSEKRMIQSTDRKIFDLNRQSEIDKEIQSLQK